MPNDCNIIYVPGLIAGSATFLRASLQPKQLCSIFCDGTAFLCLAVLLVLGMRLAAGLVL